MQMVIPFWKNCNNKCVMCTNPAGIAPDKTGYFSFVSLKKYIDSKKKHKSAVDIIYLTGGEPTIRPDFFDSVAYISKTFPLVRVCVMSNGRRFFYPDFTKKCLSFPNIEFIIPIHGWDAKSHDAVSGVPGSFAQTIGGLKNILAFRHPSQQIEIRVIIHRINYKKLNKIFDFIQKKMPSVERVVAIFAEYEGQAIKNYKSISLSHKKFYPEFRRLRKYLNKFKEIRFYHFPLCTIPKEFWPYTWRTLEKDEICFPKKCVGCSVKKICLGVHKNYSKLFGDKELEPIKETVPLKLSNNYDHPIEDVE